MPFISYAQNFEDVMLWRAFKHIEHGFYVDVGAQDPVIDSVSKAFYDRGWRGVHIEPVPHYAELLRSSRPDETVLQVALSDSEGTLDLNVIAETGLSTAVEAYARRHRNERLLEVQRVSVPAMTLKSALQAYVGKQVHWLKIDVEGYEAQVLRGWDSRELRPWVMVVEATIPGSAETDYAIWDSIVVAAGYRFVYFDGLNRFYVAQEHAELESAFNAPPNVFDDIKLTEHSSLCSELLAAHRAREVDLAAQTERHIAQIVAQAAEQAAEAAAQAAQAAAHVAQIEAQAVQFEAQATHLAAQISDMLNSRSWRVTKPLRFIGEALRRIRSAARKGTLPSGLGSARSSPEAELPLSQSLSPRAARIYDELKKAAATGKTSGKAFGREEN